MYFKNSIRKRLTSLVLALAICITGICVPARKSEAMMEYEYISNRNDNGDPNALLIKIYAGFFGLYFGLMIGILAYTSRVPLANTWRNLVRDRSTFNIYNTEETMSKIRHELDISVKGQEKAKKQILRLISGHFEAMKLAKSTGLKYNKGLVLYMTGPSGVGKTTTIQAITRALGQACFIVNRSDVKEDKSKDAKTIAQQLLDPKVTAVGQSRFEEETPFRLRMKNGARTILVFDEYEKMLGLDRERSLDELIMRDFVDTGFIGKNDCANSIVIVTSNETKESMIKNHDLSILNRIQDNVVEFEPLEISNYDQIEREAFKPLRKYYEKDYNSNIELPDVVVSQIAQTMKTKDDGARNIETIMRHLRSDLFDYRLEYSSKGRVFKNIHLLINMNNDKFSFTEIMPLSLSTKDVQPILT